MNIAVIDDDINDLEITRQFIVRFSIRRNEDIYAHYYQTSDHFFKDFEESDKIISVVILDIEMPKRSGIEIADLLRNEYGYQGEIIFLTSYPQFMMDSFDFGVGQYILKPLDYAVFEKKMDLVLDRIFDSSRYLVVKEISGEKNVIPLQDILSLHPSTNPNHKGVLKLCTIAGDFEINGRLKEFEEQLESANFIMIHRKSLINLRHVERLSADSVTLSDGRIHKVGRTKRQVLKEKFFDYMIE